MKTKTNSNTLTHGVRKKSIKMLVTKSNDLNILRYFEVNFCFVDKLVQLGFDKKKLHKFNTITQKLL